MSTETQKGHPKGLYLLFVTEMWERFSYYGMRAIFTLFMVNALMFDKTLASTVYGNYTGLVYLTPLIGGYVADRYWGNRRSIFVGGIMMAIGQFFMFLAGSFYTEVHLATTLMFIGLGFLIFGNGFFKPNISTMVGQLYKEGDKRVDSAFTIFYMGINLGAFFAPIVTGTLGEVYDASGLIVPAAFKWGFLAACIGMLLSTAIFELLKNKYIVTPDGEVIGGKPVKKVETVEESAVKVKMSTKEISVLLLSSLALFVFFKGVLAFDLIGAFIYTACLIAPATIITDKSLTKVEKDRIWVIFIIAFFVIFFWSAFEQAGASLTFFAQEQTNRNFFSWEIPSSYFQSINAVAIVIFAPIFAIIWTKLGKANREPSSPIKQSIGLFLLALGYLIIAIGVKGLDPSVKVSMMWLVTLYTIHTFGELCLSPIGLSMVVKLAPVRFASLLMGVWFLSTATANKFAGDLSKLYPEDIKVENSYSLSTLDLNGYNVDLTKETIHQHIASNRGVLEFKVNDNSSKKAELSFGETFIKNLFGTEEPQEKVVSISVNNDEQSDLSDYQKKLSIAGYGNFDHVYHFNQDHTKMYVIKSIVDKKTKVISATLEEWNLNPVKPSFLGVQITSLYHFFMIFVVLAGCASIILFLLSSKLNKMMHGLR